MLASGLNLTDFKATDPADAFELAQQIRQDKACGGADIHVGEAILLQLRGADSTWTSIATLVLACLMLESTSQKDARYDFHLYSKRSPKACETKSLQIENIFRNIKLLL